MAVFFFAPLALLVWDMWICWEERGVTREGRGVKVRGKHSEVQECHN